MAGGWPRLSEATADRIAAHPLYCNVFPEIMCQSYEAELDLDFGARLQSEALKAVILLIIKRIAILFSVAADAGGCLLREPVPPSAT